ncbi:hypothetical protein ANCCAN_27872 [Ancylostoma caninum]|uniref:Uncharacterized protein n=1 Tax=Ancylostoma caninum TaxID=29170 RepID=A0A368F2W3_ANCCA|nr:hypothetical protein ANCCAN_27872 [Ancylostoma caninum]
MHAGSNEYFFGDYENSGMPPTNHTKHSFTLFVYNVIHLCSNLAQLQIYLDNFFHLCGDDDTKEAFITNATAMLEYTKEIALAKFFCEAPIRYKDNDILNCLYNVVVSGISEEFNKCSTHLNGTCGLVEF